MKAILKSLSLLLFPMALFPNTMDLMHELEGSLRTNTVNSTLKGRFFLKAGPATTIVLRDFDNREDTLTNYSPSKKTRFRPVIGLSYRTPNRKGKLISCLDIACSYSYNDLETLMRNYSMGEIFLPKITGLHYFNLKGGNSVYLGAGTSLFTSWQNETHTKSPSLLSSNDDNIFNLRSFSFIAAGVNTVIGYQQNTSEEFSNGFQLEVNTTLFPITTYKREARTPLSAELSYILGF